MEHDATPPAQAADPETAPIPVSWWRQNIGLLAVLVVCAAVYAPSLGGAFVADDVPQLQDNRHIRDVRNLPAFFTKSVWANTALGLETVPIYRPLHLTTALGVHALVGNNPVGHHVVSVAIHLTCVALLYLLMRSLAGASMLAATLGAAVFALHPTRVESVAWLSGIPDPLALLWLLAALLAHRTATARETRGRYLALSLLCFQLALWSKEVAVVLPFVVIVHDAVVRRRLYWPALALQGVVLVAYALTRRLALGAASTATTTAAVNLSHLGRAADFALGYAQLLVFPTRIPFYLQPPEHAVASALGGLAALVLVALLAWTWRALDAKRRRVFVFALGWALCFAWPAVLMAVYKGGYYSARFMYVPLAGGAVTVALLFDHVRERMPRAVVPLVTASALVAAAYTLSTLREERAWHDNEAVYGRMVQLAPESASGYVGLGQVRLLLNDYEGADTFFREALTRAKAPQDRAGILTSLGNMQGMANNVMLSERYLREAVATDSNISEAWAGLGNLAWLQGRPRDAALHYEKAITLRPDNYEALVNLAAAYEQLGQPDRGAVLRQRAATLSR